MYVYWSRVCGLRLAYARFEVVFWTAGLSGLYWCLELWVSWLSLARLSKAEYETVAVVWTYSIYVRTLGIDYFLDLARFKIVVNAAH